MDLMEAIENRRSVRSYTGQRVERDQVEKLIRAAVQAPSASNSQPWAFVVVQDEKLLGEYSTRAKEHLLAAIDRLPGLAKYQGMLANAAFNIFYGAGTLVIICAKPGGMHVHGDCCLAAQNLMLAAHGLGLGTCWIGFATDFLNLPATKRELGIPDGCSVVAPIIVGYPRGRIPQLTRDEPEILSWRE